MQNNTFFGDYLPFVVIVLNKTTSTNDYLKELLSNFKPLPHLTAIMAKTQTQGKGQRGTTWISNPSQTLTTSIYIKPKAINTQNQFLLTAVCSLAIRDTIQSYIQDAVYIKWPNDIYVHHKKICGILIENKLTGKELRSSVVGIGLNVYQSQFPIELQDIATSIICLNDAFKVPFLHIIKDIQRTLKHFLNLLQQSGEENLLKTYNKHLYARNEKREYLIQNKPTTAELIGVEIDGLLKLKINNIVSKFDLKQVALRR